MLAAVELASMAHKLLNGILAALDDASHETACSVAAMAVELAAEETVSAAVPKWIADPLLPKAERVVVTTIPMRSPLDEAVI